VALSPGRPGAITTGRFADRSSLPHRTWMKPQPVGDGDHAPAVFIDFENLARGFNGRRDRFEIERVLERLVEKGKIVVKRAYCDWRRFGGDTEQLQQAGDEPHQNPKAGPP